MRFESIEQLKERRTFLEEARGKVKRRVVICAGTGCVAGGALDIYEELVGTLNRARRSAEQDGIGEAAIKSATFAVVAWLTERLGQMFFNQDDDAPDTFSDQRRAEKTKMFEQVYPGISYAGDEFFEDLDQLTDNEKDVLEIYYLTLLLGFQGKYHFYAE